VDLERTSFDLLLEGFPFEVLHADEHLPVIGLVNVVNDADVIVLESGGGLSFVGEAFFGFGVSCESGGKKLECDGTFQAGVFCFVDHTHAPATEVLQDLIVGNRLTDKGNHCGSSSIDDDGWLM
jgi:hypothetical protein